MSQINRPNLPVIDETTFAALVIDHNHHEIHDGNTFMVNEAYDLATDEVLQINIKTPNNSAELKYSHFLVNFNTQDEYEWYFFENTSTAQGTIFTPINFNRNSSKISNMKVYIDTHTTIANATASVHTAEATILMHGYIETGTRQGEFGGIIETGREIILKNDTNYTFRAICNSAGWVSSNVVWYECSNRS